MLEHHWTTVGALLTEQQPIARPVRNQKIIYSGHKRFHCLKFQVCLNNVSVSLYEFQSSVSLSLQSLTTPNGLIAHMYGPLVGRRHDAFMLSVSGLQSKLAKIQKQDGSPYVIYGDPAYGVSRTILAPFRGSRLTAQQEHFNKAMSRVRISVEWTFGKILSNFSYLEFKRNNKVLLQPVGKYYLVAALLTNCHTCLYGSQTSTFLTYNHPH